MVPLTISPPGSSVHGILQARILERITFPLSRGPSRPRGSLPARDQTQVCRIAGRFLSHQGSLKDTRVGSHSVYLVNAGVVVYTEYKLAESISYILNNVEIMK